MAQSTNKTPTKFVIFNHSGVIGGGEKSNLILLKNLDRRKFDPLVIFPKGPYEDLVKETGVRYRSSEIYLLRIRTLPLYIFSICSLFLQLIKEKPRFIYCNSIQSSHWGLPLGFILRKPVVVHFRDWEVGLASRFILNLFSDYFAIANTNATRNKMIKEGFMKQDRSLVVYNAVDTKEFYTDVSDKRFRTEFGFSNKDFLVGIVGRIDVWKGHLDLLEAAGLLKNKIPNLKVVIVGDNSWVKDLHFFEKIPEKIKELRLETKVVFTGFQKDIPKLLRGLDLIVIPSKNESFGRLAIEAMAVGKPVVGSNSGGLPEIIKNRPLGFVFQQGNSEELAARIKEIYLKRRLLNSFIKKESEKVKKEFSPAVYSQSLTKIFNQVLLQ